MIETAQVSKHLKERVDLAQQLPEEDLHDLMLYLKTREKMRKVCGDEHATLSLEKWYSLRKVERHQLFKTAMDTDNKFLMRFVKSWFFLKPRQKADLFTQAMRFSNE